jgi:hypothetical protein
VSKTIRSFCAAVAFGIGLGGAQPSLAAPVALELSLVIDVSGSVTATEYELQRTGYAKAFRDPWIQSQIAALAGGGGVAVNVIQFATSATQAIDWTLLTTVASINAFADALEAMPRALTGNTAIANAISLATEAILFNQYEGARMVIDLSADGAENTIAGCDTTSCPAVRAVRDDAAAEGIVINGLPILTDLGQTLLQTYFLNNVITAGGFSQPAATFDDFDRAVALKIGREIRPVPEPGSLALLGIAALAGWSLRRRPAA